MPMWVNWTAFFLPYKGFIFHYSKKPVIFLSGDDDGRAYMFEAASENANDWSYTKTSIHDVGVGTVGEVAAADVNNDGYLEVFVPAYNKNEVVVYSFAPPSAVVG